MSITYKEYNEKYRLPEQARDEQLLLTNKHHCLCYEPGKGKSMPVIHCIQEVNKMKNGKAKVLILSDATCIRNMWETDILPLNVLPKNTVMVTDRSAIVKDTHDALLRIDWDIIVCDECQSLRSSVTRGKSKYAKLVYELTRKAEYVWGMTGTIAGNNNIEPFCVLHNLNIGKCGSINCHRFKNDYCIQELQYGPFGAFHKPTKLNTYGEKFMQEQFENYCSFWGYDDDDDMPELQIEYKKFIVPETKTYLDALDGILQIGDYESTVQKTIALQKAQQALNGFMYYDVAENEKMVRNTFEVPEFHNPKLDEVIQDCKKDVQIIGYRFQEDEYYIGLELDKNNIAHTTDIQDFKNRILNGEYVILLLQCSRGKSVNLQDVCRNIIYYSCDFSFINYKQFIHRCWRRGQDKPCRIKFLINETKNDKYKIEYKVWQSLQNKQSIHDTLMKIKNEEV